MQINGFVELDRTYHQLRYNDSGADEGSYSRALSRDEAVDWRDLTELRRVVILASAGSGKTTEIRRIAHRLRDLDKNAFFLRIEHISNHLEDAFEVGDHEEFLRWIATGEEGWLLLDSVDEAKLRDPFDFDLAIRKLGRLLGPVRQSAHIVITGRSGAWRARTDLALCNQYLPYQEPTRTEQEATEGDDHDDFDIPLAIERGDEDIGGFQIYGLDDLEGAQVEMFARSCGVANVEGFLEEIDRKDAWILTTRPQDLEELSGFWKKEGRIGTRLELMENSVARRLAERDSRRGQAQPLSAEKARRGAILVAAACTLTKQSEIQTPGASADGFGLSLANVLADWTDAECAVLAERPIFDGVIYGSVRFHHRSVREYLTAEWFASLIVDQTSRSRIEALFFRTQYGVEVVVPALRSVLPWLAMRVPEILDRVCRTAPQIILEGGDPEYIPIAQRRAILRDVCEKIAQPVQHGDYDNRESIQRFASNELVADISELLQRYRSEDNVTFFLMRMIWQGRLKGLRGEAKRVALESSSKYSRIAAIRALQAVGAEAELEEVRAAFLNEADPPREVMADLIGSGLPRTSAGLQWLMSALNTVAARSQYSVDMLTDEVSRYLASLTADVASQAIGPLGQLLGRLPVFQRRDVGISVRYAWLVRPMSELLVRLIDCRHQSALGRAALQSLTMLPLAMHVPDHDFRIALEKIAPAVAAWRDLNRALFWFDVDQTRRALSAKNERLKDAWNVGWMGRAWSFESPDWFDEMITQVIERPLEDDRSIALGLCFGFYVQSGRPRKWRAAMKKAVSQNSELQASLAGLLRPPKRQGGSRRADGWYRRQRQKQEAAQRAQDIKWREYLHANSEEMRNPASPDQLFNTHHYLYDRLHDKEGGHGKWAIGRWELLAPEFGEDVATAFRDAAIAFWRTRRPMLPSEGARTSETSFKIIFGLTGLAMESRKPDWPASLTADEAEVAARYAVYELNGFPDWLPKLYDRHPDPVFRVLMREIDNELLAGEDEKGRYGTLHRLAWGGQWMADSLSSNLLGKLHPGIRNTAVLRDALNIVSSSHIADDELAPVFEPIALKAGARGSLWFAAWTGVAASRAVPALRRRLRSIRRKGERTAFAMEFATSLVGSRRDRNVARSSYRTATSELKELYLLLHEHIRESEDIERAGKGVYSPVLRDEAQEARNAIFVYIKDIPGKEAYLALQECARSHPSETARPWMRYHALAKAAQDADLAPWKVDQFRDFATKTEMTPSNQRDLWYLSVDRLRALRDDLEHGDRDVARSLLSPKDSARLCRYVDGWLRDRAFGRYTVALGDKSQTDEQPTVRLQGVGFDGHVPISIEVADDFTGRQLFDRLENQLSSGYLQEARTVRRVFLLVNRGIDRPWQDGLTSPINSFDELLEALRSQWSMLSSQYPNVEDLMIIGIDLTLNRKLINLDGEA